MEMSDVFTNLNIQSRRKKTAVKYHYNFRTYNQLTL